MAFPGIVILHTKWYQRDLINGSSLPMTIRSTAGRSDTEGAAGKSARQAGAKGDPRIAARIGRAIEGEVHFDAFSRGRYSTDASVYQIEPVGVVVPKTIADVAAVIEIAREEGLPLLPRGGGSSQCGQTVGEALVLDVSKYLNNVIDFDPGSATARVQPGIVLDSLNAFLKPEGLFFPVDVSTSSRATIGGMSGNNSCGSRSLRYGTMRDNVAAIDAILADGTPARFEEVGRDQIKYGRNEPSQVRELIIRLLSLGDREAAEIDARFPKLMRRVGGYNIDALTPEHARPNLAHLLVGSEGTLAFSSAIDVKLARIPTKKVLGVCHFPSFYQAMSAPQHIVKLGPSAVELVDRTMIELGREIPLFRPVVDRFVRGRPEAILLVEFAGDDHEENLRRLAALGELMGDLGFRGGVVEALEPEFQQSIWEVRKQGLNIMMSMKGDGKPVSFIEDCAVALEDLADYTARLDEVFAQHGTKGTWYAHASVGCLHVRPVLNMKSEIEVGKMRAIAEEAFALVREYKGSHSGEHGDGLVRSEFHQPMFGARMVESFKEVKNLFDPDGRMNPGKIVDPPKMDDRSLFRYKPGYKTEPLETALDWSDWGGFAGAVEMCNNNGACRKLDAGVMCPSYRVTRDEQHLTRGRANSLRLAISGQLGTGALTSDAMREALDLCVSCKGCKRECPTGVDMARMKIEVQYQRSKTHRLSLRDRLVAYLPRYAPWARHFGPFLNLRDRLPGLAALSERLLGLSAHRRLPKWRRDSFNQDGETFGPDGGREVVLFADTFNRAFEPENLKAALRVLTAGGYRVHLLRPADAVEGGKRPLCCGRTFLAAGLVDEARTEARRLVATFKPYVDRDVPIIGLEPSCLFTLRDELQAMLPGDDSRKLGEQALLFEEFLDREMDAGHLKLPLHALPAQRLWLHGHCHQKAFNVMGPVQRVLGRIPGSDVRLIPSSCCGMAGAFGYQAETYAISMAMAESALLPKVRQAGDDEWIVADGTSCRHQIADGAGRAALHVARVLAAALDKDQPGGA